ncbi:Receptor-like protein 12 [Cucumis melo var. makuwa]|uniref:Receptor-like protein 12 n=1 Tax=Cucumis melo var. makuwa TaxID=1194695 RepID=A0A5A7V748_CUCMM|nr:Receptor-like protein 12 [Cucumis melo var. makuwa]
MDSIREGTSTTRPPMQDGANYGYWKARMIASLKLMDSISLKMNDDETIAIFNVWVLDLANESFAQDEKITESKMVEKVLRSLPSRFSMKVTAIEEANDMTTMKLDELFGSLRTFKLSFED